MMKSKTKLKNDLISINTYLLENKFPNTNDINISKTKSKIKK